MAVRPEPIERSLRPAGAPPAPSRRGFDTTESAEALDAVGCAVLLLAADGRILRVNAACQEMTGFDPQQLVGRRADEVLVVASEADAWRRDLARTTGPLLADGVETTWRTASGAQRVMSWTARRSGPGRPIVLSAVDVTERRRRLNRLQYLVDHDELTGLLAARRLRQE